MAHAVIPNSCLFAHICAAKSGRIASMHEFSICHALVEKVLAEAARLEPPALRVCKTGVACGSLRQIVPDYLQTAYEALTKGTIAEGSVLEIREILAAGRCGACGWQGALANNVFACPACAAPIADLSAGQELYLETIELEQDDTTGD
jgi:hydrogenase nickel incorporation protein HypA/HybF